MNNTILDFLSNRIKTAFNRMKFDENHFKNLIQEDLKRNPNLIFNDFSTFKGSNTIYKDLNKIEQAFLFSAANGYMEACKYSVLQGANIHIGKDLVLAVSWNSNQLEMIKYLVEECNISPLNTYAFSHINENTSLDVFKYLYEKTNRSNDVKEISELLSAHYGNTKIFNYLLSNMSDNDIEEIKLHSNEDVKRIIDIKDLKDQLCNALVEKPIKSKKIKI